MSLHRITKKIPPLSYVEAIDMVNNIKEFRLDRLNSKELAFIKYIEDSWKDDTYMMLTARMSRWLNRIYKKVMT